MPVGNGYFISPEGETIEVNEHFEYVQQNPEQFGVTPAQAARWNWQRDRDRILARILSNGWIRVRIPQPGSFHIDTWVLDQSTLARVDAFVDEDDPWPQDRMWLSQISTGDRYEISVEEYQGEEFRSQVMTARRRACVVCSHRRTARRIRVLGKRRTVLVCGCTQEHIDALYERRAASLETALARIQSHAD